MKDTICISHKHQNRKQARNRLEYAKT